MPNKNLSFLGLEDIGCNFDFSPKCFICHVQYKNNNYSRNFNPKTKHNNVNINMDINPNTQKKINSKHNKRIR